MFRQKTAYEMLRSLVGSEMCIRDSAYIQANRTGRTEIWICSDLRENDWHADSGRWRTPVSYTHLTLPTIYSV